MILHVSKDGGKTWRPERYLCTCKGWKAQYDPLIEVVPDTGDVVAVWMNQFQIHFSRSTDHGRTWSKPIFVHPDVRWGDKPNMAVSADGQDVYVQFNGPTGGDAYSSMSHDGGATWSTEQLTLSDRYYFDYGGAVLPDGRVVFAQISFSYTGPGGAAEGVQMIHVFTSDDEGATWSELVLDRARARARVHVAFVLRRLLRQRTRARGRRGRRPRDRLQRSERALRAPGGLRSVVAGRRAHLDRSRAAVEGRRQLRLPGARRRGRRRRPAVVHGATQRPVAGLVPDDERSRSDLERTREDLGRDVRDRLQAPERLRRGVRRLRRDRDHQHRRHRRGLGRGRRATTARAACGSTASGS